MFELDVHTSNNKWVVLKWEVCLYIYIRDKAINSKTSQELLSMIPHWSRQGHVCNKVRWTYDGMCLCMCTSFQIRLCKSTSVARTKLSWWLISAMKSNNVKSCIDKKIFQCARSEVHVHLYEVCFMLPVEWSDFW